MKKMLILLGIVLSSLCINANSATLNKDIPLAETLNIAVLNTTVDASTIPTTKVVATITDGKYKGAKLNGELIHVTGISKIALKQSRLVFTSMRIKGFPKPLKITAYAIDPDTAHTALKGKVDTGYLKSNGLILATSFIQSYSKPWYETSGDTKIKTVMSRRVKIKSGTSLGILFMPKTA